MSTFRYSKKHNGLVRVSGLRRLWERLPVFGLAALAGVWLGIVVFYYLLGGF